jgi:nucleotide-binding universal stress UspA family protein
MTIRRILCATDLSPASGPAWEEARRLAALLKAELRLLYVVASVPVPLEGYFPPDLYQEVIEGEDREARERLARLVGDSASTLAITTRVERGAPAARILAVAAEDTADLLVLGTHGRSGLDRLVLGSVADRVTRSAPCPVVTVRAGRATPGVRPLARLCYATDFSPTARAAWPYAVALAEVAGATVDLLHVTPLPVPDRHLPLEALGRMTRLLREEGEARAAEFLENCPLARERVHTAIVSGDPAEQILHWAEARSTDLIVMGTHGWSGLVRWMLGSVAHHVIQLASCPVLTLGPQGREHGATS